ncbi:hypothetical protein [Pseudomonas fluorescens]|uniref:DUF1963 domain-containing protein n=2 Tax=Pseudomonas fluorescens TaxID=294 RepID=A0A8B4IBK3_PSEFL|nr:hypothetical protein [Pseudomonas fluorescens]MCI4601937.1 YwqG family protein [Pseudomonas fluorescens]MDD5441979.1 hypothetical protein [Pseudomonas fluorescens]SNY06649.1 hypothetical protein SAMN04488487_0142 [Pseudomonas fluorescens]SQF92745.1 Uncharacterised protein [Pseudomonas fluorescens]
MKLFKKLFGGLKTPTSTMGTSPSIHLLIAEPTVTPGACADTRFGGTPSVNEGFAWPTCKGCASPLQFLGQIRPTGAQHLHLIFMCDENPGECGQWEADGGANAVVCVPVNDLHVAALPSAGQVTRGTGYGARVEPTQAVDYTQAHNAFSGRRRDVLGQLGGAPCWLQAEQTPSCNHCNAPMRFVAQLEPGPDHTTEMNFAGGCAYLFECDCSGVSAKFLWQC